MAFICEIDILSHSLPSTRELLRKIFSKSGQEFGLTLTLVFTIAEKVNEESDEFLT